MSILAKLLNKKDGHQESGQIPPGLLKSVISEGNGRVRRRTYQLVAAGVLAAVASGFGLALYLESRPHAQPQAAPVVQVSAIQQVISSPKTAPVISVAPEVNPPVVAAQQTAPPVTTKAAASRRVTAASRPRSPLQPRSAATPERTAPSKDRATIDAYLFAARSAEARHDNQQALALYRQALNADPGNYRIMNNIASSLLRTGQHDEALNYVLRALALKNNYVSALVNGGIAYSLKGENAAAATMFRRAVTLEPVNRQALYNLALSQEKGLMRDDALTSFRRLADLGDVKGLLGMARVQEEKGNRGEAVRLYREITGKNDADDAARSIARKRLSALE